MITRPMPAPAHSLPDQPLYPQRPPRQLLLDTRSAGKVRLYSSTAVRVGITTTLVFVSGAARIGRWFLGHVASLSVIPSRESSGVLESG
jgi:hypothetical protein